MLCVLQSISAVIKPLSYPGSAVLDHPGHWEVSFTCVILNLVMCGQQAQCLEQWAIGDTRVCKAIGLKQGRTSPESYKQRQRLIDGMMTAFTVDGFGIIL